MLLQNTLLKSSWPTTLRSSALLIAERLADFHVLVSDAPFASQDLAATLQQSGVNDFHIAGVAGRQTDLAIGTTGRYVRVQLGGQNFLQLAEMQIYGEPAPLPPPVLAIENGSLDTVGSNWQTVTLGQSFTDHGGRRDGPI